MKNISYLINGILAVAVIILFILHFTCRSGCHQDSASLKFENDSAIVLPIAYVDVDSLLTKYTYAEEIRGILLNESENAKVSINEKRNRLAAEQQDFQKKYQNNAFISEERAKSEYERIQKLAAELERTAANLDNQLTVKQMKYNAELADSVKICIAEFNKTANYQIVLSNSGLDNVLYANSKYNITNQILDVLNSRYKSEKK